MATERSVMVRLKGNVDDFNRAMLQAAAGVAALRKEINTTNDRTAWLVQGVLALAPAAIALGAAGVPAVAALVTQLTVAAGAAGVAVLAFNGIGDALKALNDYQLDPTDAHLQKLHETMDKIGPSGEKFVRFLDDIAPKYAALANVTRKPLFEGTEKGIQSLTDDLLPRVKVVFREIAEGLGKIAAEGGKNLAGPKFEQFFDYLQDNVRPLLMDMARTLGNFIEGIGNLMVAFGPLTDRFSNGLLKMSRSFADWSEGLGTNNSFQEFLAYIEKSIPLALDFLGSLIGAMTALIEAGAPVGEILLPALTAFLNVVEQIAGSPLGPIFIAAAAAASLFGRAMALAEATTGGAFGKMTARSRESIKTAMQAKLAWRDVGNTMLNSALSQRQLEERGTWGVGGAQSAARAKEARENVKQYGKAVAGTVGQIGLMALSMSDLDNKMGLSNATLLALMGSMGGPWGAAAGAAIGLTLDFAAANDKLRDSIAAAETATSGGQAGTSTLSDMIDARQKLLDQINLMQADIDAGNERVGGFDFSKLLSDPFGFDTFKGSAFGDDIKDAEGQLGDLDKAIQSSRNELKILGATDPGRGQRGRIFFDDLTGAAHKAEVQMQDLAESITSVNNLLDRSGSLVAYERSLDDLRKSIEENGNVWDVSIEKGRKNIEARNNLVDKAITRADLLKKQGDDLGAQRILTRAIDDLERFAARTPQAKRALQPLIEELKKANDTDVKPKIKVQGVPEAVQKIAVVKTAMDALRNRTILLRVEHQDVRLGGRSYADGGHVRGPGGERGDKIKANLSDYEFVQPAKAVHKYGLKMMEDIRALRFADGGLASHGRPPAGGQGMDYQRFAAAASSLVPAPAAPLDYGRLAAAMSRVAPMYGTAHFHSEGDYERAKTERAQLTALGGGMTP